VAETAVNKHSAIFLISISASDALPSAMRERRLSDAEKHRMVAFLAVAGKASGDCGHYHGGGARPESHA